MAKVESQVTPKRAHQLTASTGEVFHFEEMNWTPGIEGVEEVVSEEQLEALKGFLAFHADYLYIFNANFRLVYANRALLTRWGIVPEEAVGRTLDELGYPSGLVELHEAQMRLAFAGRTVRGENSARDIDGNLHYFENVIAPLPGQGGRVAAVAGIAREITDRKLMEKEREELLSAFAHDLRTPLNVVVAGAHIVENQLDLTMLEAMKRNALRAVRLVDDLLDSARMRTGQKIELRKEATDLRELLGDIKEELNLLYPDRFFAAIQPDCQGYVARVDPEAVRRMIVNLAINAVKYGADDEIALRLQRSSAGCRLAVRNFGPTIPKGDRERIFELFARGEGCSDGAKKGWGIGLAVVAKLAQAHGGRVELSSDPQEGTVFSIELPA